MGAGFNAWWKTVEEFIMPMGRIVFKTCLMMLLMSAILAVDSPWHAPMSDRGIVLFKFAVYLYFACWIYPEIKMIFLHFKEAFNKENRDKAKKAFKKIREGKNENKSS